MMTCGMYTSSSHHLFHQTFFFNLVPLLLVKVASGTDSAYAALPDMLSCICSGCWTSRKRNSKLKFDSNDTTLFDMMNHVRI